MGNFLGSAIEDGGKLFRATLLLLLMCAFVAGTVYAILTWGVAPIVAKRKVEIKTTEGGGLVVRHGGKTSHATFSVPASAGWRNTGIPLEKGKSYNITASGQAHLALRHLVDGAEHHTPLQFQWTGPEGYAWLVTEPKHVDRRQLLIDPK